MLNFVIKDNKFNYFKLCIVILLFFTFSGCRALSDMLDTDNTQKEKLQAAKRQKPELSQTPEIDIDPDSDEIEEEPVSDKEIKELNKELAENKKPTDENESNSNTNVETDNADNSKSEADQKAENLVGKWEGKVNKIPVLFDFVKATKEGDNYVGKLSIYMDNELDGTYKYAISKDGKVTLTDNEETNEVDIKFSDGNNSMSLAGDDGTVINLKRSNSANPNSQK